MKLMIKRRFAWSGSSRTGSVDRDRVFVPPAWREDRAQGTVEYALTVVALLAVVVTIGALWRAGERGALTGVVERAASHGLTGLGPLDIALF